MFDRFNRRGLSSLFLLLPGLVLGFTADRCAAQLSAEKKSELIVRVQQAKESLGQRPFPSPQQAGERVIDAAGAVADYLSRRTSAQRAANWLDYIDSDRLVDAIQADRSATQISNAARRLQSRLVGNVVGLEMPPLLKLRNEIDALVAANRYPDPERALRRAEQELELLARQLETGDPSGSPDDAAILSLAVQWLDQSNQAPELVSELYQAFSRPNVVVTIGGHLVQDAITRPVDRARPVRDCILGTRIIGNGRLQGQVLGRLAPSIGRVQVDLVLTGQFYSDSVGYNGPVRLPSIGHGTVTASRSLWIGESGVSLSQVNSSVALQTTITSIQHPLRIVRRIASKQIAQKKPQADQIARQRLRDQVVNDFSNQSAEAAQRIGSRPADGSTLAGDLPRLDQAYVFLKRLNLSPPTRLIGSTTDSVFVQATQRSGKQLAAITSPPPAFGTSGKRILGRSIQRGDASLQVHESLIDNLASTIFGGRIMTGDQIDRLLGSVRNGAQTPTTKPESDAQPDKFEIEFSTVRPIIFEARDRKIRLGLRGNRFSQEGTDLRSSLEITATYEAVDLGGYQVLRRIGGVAVDFPGTGRIAMQQVAQRRSIQKLFDDRFPETLLDQPIILPILAAVPTLSGRVFRYSGIDAQNGWLTLSVR